jgi:excisionase family DNA binding protein
MGSFSRRSRRKRSRLTLAQSTRCLPGPQRWRRPGRSAWPSAWRHSPPGSRPAWPRPPRARGPARAVGLGPWAYGPPAYCLAVAWRAVSRKPFPQSDTPFLLAALVAPFAACYISMPMKTSVCPSALATDDDGGRLLAGGVYSVSQAAVLLGVSRMTLSRWIRAGRLPAARLGHRTVRISREDLVAFLAAHRQGAAPVLPGNARPTGTAADGTPRHVQASR